ncbi:hypothetical protein C487_10157 [Natrinema pallidum DSM 3751]|uniref:Uncharacterized protein n=1 Tax=Natrinema pallidum DSM 3751 TaxID=1227495 RepID=L9YT43_9EURY|nr:hypothetical protein C487_10157 [Natrinema pallidum DSM 3751]
MASGQSSPVGFSRRSAVSTVDENEPAGVGEAFDARPQESPAGVSWCILDPAVAPPLPALEARDPLETVPLEGCERRPPPPTIGHESL